MSYCQPTDLISRIDARSLGQLVNDTGQQLSVAELVTDKNVQAALDDGTSLINSAIKVSNRYTVTDLAKLTGTGLNLLIRLNCDLAYAYLCMRRGYGSKELSTLPQWTSANAILEQLRSGEKVFDLVDVEEAGLIQSGFPSCVTYSQLNLARDYNAKFFPIRRTQLPLQS